MGDEGKNEGPEDPKPPKNQLRTVREIKRDADKPFTKANRPKDDPKKK